MKKNKEVNLIPKQIEKSCKKLFFAGLTSKEVDIPFSKITLGQFERSKNYMNAYYTLRQEFFIDSKFKNKYFSDNISEYHHNLMQFSMEKYFKEKNFKITGICFTDDEDRISASKKIRVEYAPNKFFFSQSDAFVFLENEKEKIFIKISRGFYDSGSIFYEIQYSGKDDITKIVDGWVTYSNKHNFYKGKKINAEGGFLKINKDISWDNIIIEDDFKQIIKRNISDLFEMESILEKNNITLKRGIILSGTPGTGKTMICKVLAKELDVTVLYVLPSHIKQSSDISRICDMAKDLAPTLLILEDIDYIAEDRDSSSGNLVVDLMNKMDGLEDFKNVITLATTNLVDKIEKALKNRPGRFDRVIEILNPNLECREKMLRKFTSKFKTENVDFDKNAEATEGMSGAFLKDVVLTSAFYAIADKSLTKGKIAILKQDHFDRAIDEIKNKKYTNYKEVAPKEKIGFGFATSRQKSR